MATKVQALILLVLLTGSLSIVEPVLGAQYPTGPVEIYQPYGVGGSMDLLARLIGDIAPKYLGQPVVAISKPGGGGAAATAEVIKSKPDGYKLLLNTSSYFATTVKSQEVPFDPNDVIPIGCFMEYRSGMFVRTDSGWNTLNDLLDYGRKHPGNLKWNHPGRGITLHMGGLLIFKRAGIETIDAPYKGGAETVAALLGGHVDASAVAYGAAKEHIRAGKLKGLVMFNSQRYSDPPDVPCAAELGFEDVGKLRAIIGLFVHKNTPEEIKKTLINTFRKVYEDPEFRKGVEKVGEEPTFGEPKLMYQSIADLEEVGVPILKELGLYKGR